MKTVLVILILVLVLLQVRLWIGDGGMAEIVRLQGEIEEQTEQNASLEARNSALKDEVGDLRNGLDSIEERARNELGLIRQGETFYLIVEDDGVTSPRGAETGPSAGFAPATAVVAEPPIETVVPEPPPEIVEEDNPYLELFRDEEPAPDQVRADDSPATATGLPAGR